MLMKSGFVPNPNRIKQRRLEVMEAAWRARQFSIKHLVHEALDFLDFGLKLAKDKRG